MFVSKLNETLNEEFNNSMTENGALGYRTSGKALLDINFAVSSMRNMSESEIIKKFMLAFYEDKTLAMKWLFYSRDVRGGLGERRLFRVIIKHLADNETDYVEPLVNLFAEYGRYDDLLVLLDTRLSDQVIDLIRHTLKNDWSLMEQEKPVSLMAKWLPSTNASSKETVRLAKKIVNRLGVAEKNYRQTLSALRKHIDVVERKMSAKEWGNINYQAVPSRANLIYNNAFLKNDEERRREFLSKLSKGEVKINAGVLFPHDIVHKYNSTSLIDNTLEALWKALPDTVQGNGNTIVVADGSGSMMSTIGNTSVSALSAANALAIYFAERSSGQFKDKYITFSRKPKLVDFSKAITLREKIRIALLHNEVANTDIEAVFDLILTTAIKSNMAQEDLPQNILILSDMEFDQATSNNASWWNTEAEKALDKKLFKSIEEKYKSAGYKLPRLIFWNLLSKTGTIPVKENDLGVALVSGFSPNIINMVMSNKLDPYECLLEILNSERYQPIHYELSLPF